MTSSSPGDWRSSFGYGPGQQAGSLSPPLDLHQYRDTVTVTVAPTLTQTRTVMLTLTLAPTALTVCCLP